MEPSGRRHAADRLKRWRLVARRARPRPARRHSGLPPQISICWPVIAPVTLAQYGTVPRETPQFLTNTLLFCGIAALIDVMLGVVIAWLLHRPRLPGRALLDLVAMSALAVPGLVLGIGILRTYFHVHLPGGGIPSRRPGPC